MRRALPPRSWGVRVRSAVAALAIGAVAAVVAGLALLWLLRSSLQDSADASAASRCAEIAIQLQTDPPTELDRALLATTERTTLVQVLDSSGAVVVSSAGAPTVALTTPVAPADRAAPVTVVDSAEENGDYRVTAQGVATSAGEFTVVVAAAQQPITETLTTVAALLAVGAPVLVVLLGGATYAVVGRSLRPVERMRAKVNDITTADLSERLPVPHSEDEISRLAVTLNAMLGRLEAGHDAQRRFVADASHELRSPLATVTAALELAADRPAVLDDELVGQTLLPEAQRMQRLVEDLLLLAKADERGLPLRVTDVDLDDIVDTEVRRVRAAHRHTVTASVTPTRVRGDAGQLARVVRNLTDNAARHARSAVVLTCRPNDAIAELLVDDDGPGVPPAERARVLERFVRLDSDRARAAGGSGLGLAIVAEIVAAHGGHVAVSDSPSGGARFSVSLPVDGPAQSLSDQALSERKR